MKKIFLTVTLIIACLLTLSACGGGKLSIYHSSTDYENGVAKDTNYDLKKSDWAFSAYKDSKDNNNLMWGNLTYAYKESYGKIKTMTLTLNDNNTNAKLAEHKVVQLSTGTPDKKADYIQVIGETNFMHANDNTAIYKCAIEFDNGKKAEVSFTLGDISSAIEKHTDEFNKLPKF